MIDSRSINSIFDATVIDGDGEKVGTAKQVYVDHDSGRPLFVGVATGLFGTSESLVPLYGAVFDGESLRIPHDKATVKDAPRIDADGVLTSEEQDRLWDYYRGADGQDEVDAEAAAAGAHGGVHEDHGGDGEDGEVGGERSEPTSRSEERLDVSEGSIPAGRVRLRRYVVTEQRNVTVPVRHEEIRIERETIADEDPDDAARGRDVVAGEDYEVSADGEPDGRHGR